MTTCQEATTIASLIADAADVLHKAGVEQPRLEARWLLGRLLDRSQSSLLAHPDDPVNPDGAERYRDGVRRRAAREPFAYVVGEREFFGRSFLVDRRVLVPRPETEILVTEALAVLRARRPPVDRSSSMPGVENGSAVAQHPPLVVDVGTGSGAIACTLALEAPDAAVVACDVSPDALAVAAQNRERLGLRDRLRLVRGSLLSWLLRPADLVVANLPYIPSARVLTLMPEVSRWEPRLALDGGADGLDLVRELLADAPRAVNPGGTILLELDPEQIEPARALMPEAGSTVISFNGLERVLRLDLP